MVLDLDKVEPKHNSVQVCAKKNVFGQTVVKVRYAKRTGVTAQGNGRGEDGETPALWNI